MNKIVFKFLNEYGSSEHFVNKLLVSSFIYINKVDIVKNSDILKLMIKENEEGYDVLVQFMNILERTTDNFGFESLLELFEFVISPEDKLTNGAIYTPKNIRKYITDTSFQKKSNNDYIDLKIGDLSCGCGGFLIDAAKKIKEYTEKNYSEIFKDNIYGLDIQAYSIERTKILLTLLALVEGEDCEKFEFNLYVDNALRFDWLKENKKIKNNAGFDILLGNPPYVASRNMDEESKSLLTKWSVSSTGHPDLYIPFFQICHTYLKDNGILGYITVNTFFKSINGRAIRKYFSDNKIQLKIIDFAGEQVFKSRSTYTCLCFIQKATAKGLEYIQSSSQLIGSLQNKDFKHISYDTLDAEDGWILTNQDVIKRIEQVGKKFGVLYKTRNGIATLKNKIYNFEPLDEDENYYYIDKDTPIEKAVCKDIINPNKLIKKRVLKSLVHKIIFPYIYDSNDNINVIDEITFRKSYPKTYQYLLSQKELLSTRDKGNGKYPVWYAYGRNQSLDKMKYKLFFPHITPHLPHYRISSDENLLFYNGIAVISEDREELYLLKQIMSSDVFWFYIESTSKNYSSGYYSLSRNYIKNFGIYPFSKKEKAYILNEKDSGKINTFICDKYGFNEDTLK